jgi:sulfite exporter TauE/SafE
MSAGADDLPLLLAVLVTSLVGSLHCAGMCGVFVAMATGVGQGARERARLQAMYHGGRLIGYSALGVACGALGQALDLGAASLGLSRVAIWLAAGTIVAVGLVAVLKESGVRLPRTQAPKWAQRLFQSGATAAQRLGPVRRAGVIGLLTVLLPCGWLYAFAIMAAGTASPLLGGLVMMTFWIGTVPVLAFVGLGAGAVRQRLGPRARLAAGCLVMAIGAATLMRATGAELSGVREAMGADASGAMASPVVDVDAAKEAPCPLCESAEEPQ